MSRLVRFVPFLAALSLSPVAAAAPIFKVTSQAVVDGVKAAANRWSAALLDNVTINLYVSYAALGNTIAQSSPYFDSFSYATFRSAYTSRAVSPGDATALGSLPGGDSFGMLLNYTSNSPYGVGSPTPYLDNDGNLNNTTIYLTYANSKALGLRSPTDIRRDASLTFNNALAWDYDPSDGIGAGQYDMVGIASHEIGHALGFWSGVDALDTSSPDGGGNYYPDTSYPKATPLDLFRYSTASAAQGVIDWTADARDKYFSLDRGATSGGSFSTGKNHGDGRQAGHWKIGQGIGALDPVAIMGQPEELTAADFRAIDAIGFDPAAALSPGEWRTAGGGNWGDAASWIGDIPDGQAATASFWRRIAASAAVDLQATDRTVNRLSFDHPTAAYSVASGGGGRVLLQAAAGTAAIDVVSGSHAVSAPVVLAAPTVVTVAGGAQLTLSGPLGGAQSLTKSGPGTLAISGDNFAAGYSGPTVVNGGTLELAGAGALREGASLTVTGGATAALAGSLAAAVKLGAVSLDGGSPAPVSTLQLNGNRLIADKTQTPMATLRAQIVAAYAGGTWSGAGVTSAVARADYQANPTTPRGAVGCVDNADPLVGGRTSWGGRSVDANSLLVAYTAYGDANLDGAVNLADYAVIKVNYGKTGAHWHDGDFDYNGTVNLGDYGRFKNMYGTVVTYAVVPPSAPAAHGVPEPGAAVLLLAATVAGLALRRRRPPARPA